MDNTLSSINALLPKNSLGVTPSVSEANLPLKASTNSNFSKHLQVSDVQAQAIDDTSIAEELRAKKVKSEFEAVIISQFVGEMLSSTSEVFGDGMQGDLINTVLTDAISKQIAQGNGLGIGKLL